MILFEKKQDSLIPYFYFNIIINIYVHICLKYLLAAKNKFPSSKNVPQAKNFLMAQNLTENYFNYVIMSLTDTVKWSYKEMKQVGIV